MIRRVLLRLGGAVVVLWAVATAVFFLIRLIPGDPAQAILGGPGSQASAEALAAVREEYGLDQPLLLQYLTQLGRLAQGDLGTSYSLRVPVVELLGQQLPGTLLLAVLALALAWILALATALWSTRGGRIAAALGAGLELTAAALPHFWLATVLIAVFATTLRWLPPVSTGAPNGLVLPALTLAIPLAGFLGQVMRRSLLDALESPFVLAARARGESELGLRLRHALRHAVLPGIALSGWAFGYLIGGAVVVETIFARPGLGRTLLSAVTVRDVPVVTGVVLVAALAYILVTFATDLVARLVDPRLAPARVVRAVAEPAA
ncbi:ABC transporter permease [Rathayibacter sp. Leaf296]|uniref:ABC transporter permease n=1 Tax=Rathayibacter sp. Leaf296 TaxID=1736327 RepID=UPI0007032879|nr:ABC transporter permease [Rathayibacter sp. Leaf296]KQQ08608.1 ABC transporter permease [Rathayibacter sp. Leaf296]